MGIHFNRLEPLLLIPIIGIILFLTYKRFLISKYKRALIFRSITMLLIILSLCSIYIVKVPKETTTIFLADLSNSTLDRRKDVEAFIIDALKYKTDKDIVGVIGFGNHSTVEVQPGKEVVFNQFESSVAGEFTNIATGLITANAIIPNNTKRRIVLLTDGYENVGDGRKQLQSIASHDTSIDVVDLSDHQFDEVQFEGIELPSKVEKTQIVDIQAKLISNVKTTGTLFIYSNNKLKYETPIEVNPGDNLYLYTDQISDSGLVTYSAQIIVDKDTYNDNNFVSGYTFVNDLPKLLVLQGEDEQALNLIGMLDPSSLIDVKKPEEAPSTLEEMIKYDGFILANVSIETLSSDFLIHLEEAVRLQGKGLLVTGGETSYGPGGYYKTILETMLPINMDAKPKEEKPNLALMLVIDKSGSMSENQYGITKMELAKEAAIRSIDVLEVKDYLGVIGFDSFPTWVLETTLVTDKKDIINKIGVMAPGGGTSIQPSLAEAITALKDIDAGLKHIILLTDGQAESTGYMPLIEQIQTEKITLSTVAVGGGADRKLLKLLAQYGNGRYYETGVFSDIPSIFTKEAFMAGKKYLNNTTFVPMLTADSPIMSGITGLPELDGYVATSKKEQGKVILSGPDIDPILASWQYGLGRSVAFTSDMKGIWSKNWLAWDGNQNFWINTMSWLIQQDLNKDYKVDGRYENGNGVIDVERLIKGTDYASIEGLLTSPVGNTTSILLDAKAPGKYKGIFQPEGPGVYLVSLSLPKDDKDDKNEKIITAVNIGYSKEYDFFGTNNIAMDEITGITDGRLLTQGKDVFIGKVATVSGSYNISNILLILALLCFMLEIILRKFKPPVQQIKEKALVASLYMTEQLKKETVIPENKESAVDQLLQQKRKRNK